MRPSHRFSRIVFFFIGLGAFALLGVTLSLAQVDVGSISGSIRDPSGAVIPGTRVTVTNEGTSLSISTLTNRSGWFTFTPVRIGSYTVAAEYKGFKTARHVHVVVNLQQHVVLNFTLQPGSTKQSVTVTAAPPQLETQSASTGQVVARREVNDLPLNGRNYTFLAQLGAGVTTSQQDNRGEAASGTFAANGLRPSQNDYLLDGIDNNNNEVDFLNGTGYAVLPPVDAIQEFKVLTSNYSAEFGRAGGAVLNATLRSGTNQLHGDAWEFLRNSGLDAANFFENSSNQPKGEFRQNQFGFTLGGPVLIPHVYNGKDRTFFFVDYQGTRIRQASPWVSTVPTALERDSGYTNFSQLITGQTGSRTDLLGRSFPLGTVFDPATTRPVTAGQADPVTGVIASGTGFVRDPFPGNIIPASRLDLNAIKLLKLYPAPNGSGLFNNFASDPIINEDVDQFDTRMDHSFSDKDQTFGTLSYYNEPLFTPGPFTGIADGGSFNQGTYETVSVNSALSETHTFSPTTINEARVGYSRIATTQFQPFANTLGIPAQFGIGGIPQLPTNGGLPSLFITGLSTLGSNGYLPGKRVGETFQLLDNFTKIYSGGLGSHTFKGGFEFQHLRAPWFAPEAPRGYFYFGGTYTEVPATSGGNTGIAQMLLSPTATSVANGINDVGGANQVVASNFAGPDNHRNYYGTYFQDDWKMTSKLTVNLGLRWEFFGQQQELFGAQANFVPGPPNAGAQYLIQSQSKNVPLSASFLSTLPKDGIKLGYTSVPGSTDTPLHQFGPRVGVAYQISPRAVFRAGYGIFYDGFENIGGSPDIGSNYPFLYNFSFSAPDPGHPIVFSNGSVATLETGLTGIPLSPTFVNAKNLALAGLQMNWNDPLIQEYNAALQLQLTPNQTVAVGYVGNTVRYLYVDPGSNEASRLFPPNVNYFPTLPYPDFAPSQSYLTAQGNSYYNGLQTTFQRRFSGGLDVLANYTYSKCRTDARDLLNNNIGGYRAAYLPGFGIQGDYAFCDFDVRNVAHLSGTYTLPVGSGQRFLRNATGVENTLLGGWVTNWILTLQDGQPFTIPCNVSTTADFGCNALFVPGQNSIAGPHDVNHWMNPAAFTNPPVATATGQTSYAPLGGTPTQLVGPGFHRLDFSLFKQFAITENKRLEFRTEVFNITNTPQFANPGFSGNGVTAAPGALDFSNLQNFGRITTTRDGALDQREIQFALKFYW
jgi:hypothetical protein